MKRTTGFTLLELIVVIGIMGMLGVAATAGYTALQRGMSDRGAVAVAATVLRTAQERAHVDRVPTCVFCYNRLLVDASDTENAVVVGCMVAIRRSGRITYVKGDLLFDEFADLDTTYESAEENEAKEAGRFRLFRFAGGKPKKMEYSIVSDQVVSDDDSERITLFSDRGLGNGTTNLFSTAFLDVGGGTISSWSAGDGYAFVFAETQLPEGYVFGRNVPTDTKNIKELNPIVFDPDADASDAVQIYWTRPDGNGKPQVIRKAGEASAKSEEAV